MLKWFGKFNKKILITTAAIVVSCAVGIPVAITSMADTNTPEDSSNIVSSSVTSSLVTSSDISSADDSAVSDITSNETSSNNIVNRSIAIASENTRHQNTLATINNQYDPQIATLQGEIQGYRDQGGADVSCELETQYQVMESAHSVWATALSNQNKSPNSVTTAALDSANSNYELQLRIYNEYKTDEALYEEMVPLQNNLTDLQGQKTDALNKENDAHAENLAEIS
jgi:hypothetical protein